MTKVTVLMNNLFLLDNDSKLTTIPTRFYKVLAQHGEITLWLGEIHHQLEGGEGGGVGGEGASNCERW
jgi:hypothetical protein